MHLRADGADKLITDKSKLTIWDGSHVIAKKLKTKFTAVSEEPELTKLFDVEHTTSLSEIKEEILVELKGQSLEVSIVGIMSHGLMMK
jgi:hypothetical protein